MAGRSGPVRTADLWIALVAFSPCWGAAYVATFLVHRAVSHAAPVVQLALCVPVGLAAALVIALCLKRPRATVLDARQGFRYIADTLLSRTSGKDEMPVPN